MGPELDSPRGDHHPRRRAIITIALATIVVMAVFLLDVLVVPAVVLVVFCLGFAASDRAKRDGGGRLSA
jgi:Flp pilus assembly protein TadB